MTMRIFLLLFLLIIGDAAFAQGPPIGMYKGSEDYLSQHPSNTAVVFRHIAQMEGDGLNSFHRLLPDGKRGNELPAKDYFAASDGKTFYISYDGKWYKARKADSAYYFIRPRNAEEIDHRGHPHIYTRDYAGSGYSTTANWTAIAEGDQKYRWFYDAKEGMWKAVDRFRKR